MAERKTAPGVSNLNKCLGATMLASPVPIYLGCAALVVGSLGLGAHHLLGGTSGSSANAVPEQPLFAQSVEEASLPSTPWPSQNRDVAYYAPMVELLTEASRSAGREPAAAPQSASAAAVDETKPAPREVVRDLSPPPAKPPKRAKKQRNKDDARDSTEATASVDPVDPREARAQAEPDLREPAPRRSQRNSRAREEAEPVDVRSRPDRRRPEVEERRLRESEGRVVIRDEMPEPRYGRAVDQRDGGFSPFRLFGIFDPR